MMPRACGVAALAPCRVRSHNGQQRQPRQMAQQEQQQQQRQRQQQRQQQQQRAGFDMVAVLLSSGELREGVGRYASCVRELCVGDASCTAATLSVWGAGARAPAPPAGSVVLLRGVRPRTGTVAKGGRLYGGGGGGDVSAGPLARRERGGTPWIEMLVSADEELTKCVQSRTHALTKSFRQYALAFSLTLRTWRLRLTPTPLHLGPPHTRPPHTTPRARTRARAHTHTRTRHLSTP